MSDRNFNNIINFTIGQNTANAAILEIMGNLKGLQAIARETGVSLTAALTPSGMGSSSEFYRQLMQVQDIGKRIRDITMGGLGMPVGGRMPGAGTSSATGGIPTPDIVQNPEKVERTSNALGHLGSRIRSIAIGMAVWQGMNVAWDAFATTVGTVIGETSRLDSTAARLSVTLNTTKENARQYAQALSMMGVAYGMTPETSQYLGFYASRVNKNQAGQQEMFRTAAALGGLTGEDPKKLIDDLNVAYRQTGISVTQLGDMAARAWSNSGTSASDYLNILREVGPLAISAGIDIEKMAGVSAVAADRMGGSMSDAANTLTRLIKAVQDPNELQKSVLLRYGINYGKGADVQEALNRISQAGMSATDMAALGGRPGQPAVANDIRTILSVFKEYKGELQSGKGLQDQFTQSMDSMDAAHKRLVSSMKVLAGSFSEIPVVASAGATAINTYAVAFEGLAAAIESLDIGTIAAIFNGFMSGNIPQVIGAAGGALAKRATGPAYRGGMYQPGGQGQSMSEFIAQQPSTSAAAASAVTPANLLPFPTSETDISKYTRAQYDAALAMTSSLFENWMNQYEAMLRSMGMEENSIANAMKDERERIAQTNTMLQSGTGFQNLQGYQAYFLQMALGQQKAAPDTSKLESLQDRLAELRQSLEDLDETEKKRAQLEGQWNIPAGAKLLVPLTAESQALMKEHGGESEDQSRERRRRQIEREIAQVEEKIRKEQENLNKQAAMGGIFDNLGGAANLATNALFLLAQQAKQWGGYGEPPGAWQEVRPPTQAEPSWTREPEGAWGEVPLSPLRISSDVSTNLALNATFNISATPVIMDSQKVADIIFPMISKRLTDKVNYVAQGSGYYAQ